MMKSLAAMMILPAIAWAQLTRTTGLDQGKAVEQAMRAPAYASVELAAMPDEVMPAVTFGGTTHQRTDREFSRMPAEAARLLQVEQLLDAETDRLLEHALDAMNERGWTEEMQLPVEE